MRGFKIPQQLTDHCRLTGAYFSSDNNKALFALDTVVQPGQGFPMVLTIKEKLRIRCEIERRFPKSKIVEIHGRREILDQYVWR